MNPGLMVPCTVYQRHKCHEAMTGCSVWLWKPTTTIESQTPSPLTLTLTPSPSPPHAHPLTPSRSPSPSPPHSLIYCSKHFYNTATHKTAMQAVSPTLRFVPNLSSLAEGVKQATYACQTTFRPHFSFTYIMSLGRWLVHVMTHSVVPLSSKKWPGALKPRHNYIQQYIRS